MTTKTYNNNNGKYQDRAEYYYTQIQQESTPIDNKYLDVYRNALTFYANVHHFGIRFFDKNNESVTKLLLIRDMEGLSRSWGYTQEIVDIITRWRAYLENVEFHNCCEQAIKVEAQSLQSLLVEELESFMDTILEVLPSYVPLPIVAKLAENQPIVNFLHARSNDYRAIGNPKFYAYDRVVATISNSNIPVTATNCKFFNGVGPRITQHITEFLSGTQSQVNQEHELPLQDSIDLTIHQELPLQDSIDLTVHHELPLQDVVNQEHELPLQDVVNQEHELPLQDAVSQEHELPLQDAVNQEHELPLQDAGKGDKLADSDPVEYPHLVNNVNKSLAEYLWNTSVELYSKSYFLRAIAWRRAAETVFSTTYCVQECLDTVHLPFIGETMTDVIHDFYYKRAECPVASIDGEDGVCQQYLLNLLWLNDFYDLAIEIAESRALPLTRSDFKKFNTYDENVIKVVFPTIGDLPSINNWSNFTLLEWLWAYSKTNRQDSKRCYRAAISLARKRKTIYIEQLGAFNYITPFIAERARGELIGIVDQQQYRDMREELDNLRQRLHELTTNR